MDESRTPEGHWWTVISLILTSAQAELHGNILPEKGTLFSRVRLDFGLLMARGGRLCTRALFALCWLAKGDQIKAPCLGRQESALGSIGMRFWRKESVKVGAGGLGKLRGVLPSHHPFWYLLSQGQDWHVFQLQGGGRSVRVRSELQDRSERWVSFPYCLRDFFCATLHARVLLPLPLGQQMQQWGALEAGAGICGLGKAGLSPPLQGVSRRQAAACSTCALITLETGVSRKPGPASQRCGRCPGSCRNCFADKGCIK